MTTSETQTRAQRPGGTRFRPDIEGIRALAVVLVMLHHAGLAEPSGGFAGVDIFFVVSGFVITTQLLRELDRDGHVSLITFYGRRAKRLLPAAGVVLVVTTLAAWLMVSRVQWSVIAQDIVGASLYVVNWVLAAQSVDYLAQDVEPSPVLHFWSLAVEEQFYVVWPLVILGLVWLVRRRTGPGGAPSRVLLALGMTFLIVLPSLGWALYLTQTDPDRAFFVTTTRLWELGIGALVAIGAGVWGRINEPVAAVIAWAGLAVVLGGAMVQDTSTLWPGPGALVPVVGTTAMIVGGFSAGRRGPTLILGTSLLVWIGGLSYSLYLWHWPVLRIATWRFGELSVWEGLFWVVASAIPAWLVFRMVEQPVRHATGLNRSPRFALSVGFNCTLVALAAGLLLGSATSSTATAGGDDVRRSENGTSGDAIDLSNPTEEISPPDAEAAEGPAVYEVLTPDPINAVEDVPALYEEDCQVVPSQVEPVRCEWGDPNGDVVIAVVGDSKIAQWMPGLGKIALANGWRIVSYTKSACPAIKATVLTGDEPYTECREWGRRVLAELSGEDAPDVFLTSGRRTTAGEGPEDQSAENLVEGYAEYWRDVADQEVEVIVLGDSPKPGLEEPVYECVADHPDNYDTTCSWEYSQSEGSKVLEEAAEQVEGATFIDMDPWVCPAGTCHGVYRNIVTFRQGSHLTATFVRYLASPLAQKLVPLVLERSQAGGT